MLPMYCQSGKCLSNDRPNQKVGRVLKMPMDSICLNSDGISNEIDEKRKQKKIKKKKKKNI
jgi:hypothetical protein